jgi:hypothetical protein
VLYLLTVSGLESRLQKKYEREITNIYLSDMTDILNGLVSVKDAIRESISGYVNQLFFLKIGGQLDIDVTTKQGNILYPATYQNSLFENIATDPPKLAEKNFEVLNEGIDIQVGVNIPHYSLLAVSLLLFYVLIFLGGLYGYYRKVSAKLQQDENLKTTELNRLQEIERERLEQISSLSEERELLQAEYEELQSTFQKEISQAEKTEEDLFEEIASLENKLKEIDQLKEKITDLEKNQTHISRQKDKSLEKLGKRFKVLYKNIDISDRALSNLMDLPEDMGLKAEEVIHQLNNDASLVPIKRKVFSKKGNTTCFEVTFAYNGRLYFRRQGNQVEILTIGTKNTQARDLVFLEKV